uniref:Uncharacterized protein n=1 Tax=Avena sativa TaxID=4498 RepID=A0ACD5TE22_AVESA
MGNVLPLPCMCKDARVMQTTAAGTTKKRRNRPVATARVNAVDTPDQDGGLVVQKSAPWWSGRELDVGEEYGVRQKVVMTRKDAAEFMAGLEERAAAERKDMVWKLGGAGNGVMSPCPDAWRPRLATIPEN